MFSDYRAFGIAECDLATSGTFTADAGSAKGTMLLNCIASATLTGVTFTYDRNTQAASPYAINLVQGQQLVGVKAFTISAGSVQVLYFKS